MDTIASDTALPQPPRTRQRPPFECIALTLQGGGALGAYQAGVYQALIGLPGFLQQRPDRSRSSDRCLSGCQMTQRIDYAGPDELNIVMHDFQSTSMQRWRETSKVLPDLAGKSELRDAKYF